MGVVVVHSEEGLKQTMDVRQHHLVADEPVDLGGTDAGPTPYDYLLAALGSCISITLKMYATKKGWPLEAVRVSLRHAKIHAADCADCETKAGILDQIECELQLTGPLDAEQRRWLLTIAELCPVHKTLKSEIRLRTRLV